MEPANLYDLSPALHLMGMGLAVATGPLAWMWLRHRGASPAQRLQALTLLTLFLTFDLVLFGAFTRLTDSGLGCPDWPGCYGSFSPVGARDHIAVAEAAMPSGPVTHGKAWIEMVHRYLATGVGVLIIALTLLSWRLWRRDRRGVVTGLQAPAMHPAWAMATLVWVCAQGAFGALTVTMKLFPAIVTTHLLGGVGLLVLLVVQAEHARRSVGASRLRPVSARARGLLWATTLLVGLQIALGGWVSTNYAVLACSTFPTCQGSWWPVMDFAQGFQIWRPLGRLADGSLIGFPALTAIHYTHRLFAYLVFAVLVMLLVRLYREGALPVQRRLLLVLGTLQLVTGLSNVILGWPLVAAVLHTGGAAAMMTVAVWALVASRRAAEQPGRAAPMNRTREMAT